MTEPVASKLDVGKGEEVRSIAALTRAAKPEGAGLPGVVWLGGYRSDMTGSKAEALCHQAGSKGQACLRFDYSGHGASGGSFREGTISRWLEESLAAFEHYTTDRRFWSARRWAAGSRCAWCRSSMRADRATGSPAWC